MTALDVRANVGCLLDTRAVNHRVRRDASGMAAADIGCLPNRRSRIERTVLDESMAQPPPGSEPTGPGADAPAVPMPPAELDQARRTSMAAERTWLAWWRSALAASAGALGVGRLAPEILHVAPWPYVILGS